tara:strand:+ start:363 stop:752 length:390 start_codon:yes stop_codon:yes gene_type:complete
MASILKVDTITGVATAGSIAVTGEGNSTTTNLQQGLAKAWVASVTDSSSSIAGDSFNTSGFTDIGTGNSNHTMTSVMNAADFCVMSTAHTSYPYHGRAESTSTYKLRTVNSSGSSADGVRHGSVHGDLA